MTAYDPNTPTREQFAKDAARAKAKDNDVELYILGRLFSFGPQQEVTHAQNQDD